MIPTGDRPPLSLDQVVRFEPIIRLICQVAGRSVLDVGSGSSGVGPLLPHPWRVTGVDSSFEDYGAADGPMQDSVERIVADARRLPFEDRAFDVVVAVDLLEHIPASDREAVADEIARVARRRVIVACPTGQQALAADRRLADVFHRRGTPLPGWLVEHLCNGFPETEQLSHLLRGVGSVRLMPNEGIVAHERLMRLTSGRVGVLVAPLAVRLLVEAARQPDRRHPIRRTALSLLRAFDRSPCYRTIAVADRPSSAT
jgi:SAM-dependent methyltransferase